MDFMGYNPSDQQLRCAFRLADISGFAYRRMDDERRVTAVEAYFSSPAAQPSAATAAAAEGDIEIDWDSVLQPVYQKHFHHFICEMRDHLMDMIQHFNHSALPTPVQLDAAKSRAGRLPFAFTTAADYYSQHQLLCQRPDSVALSAWDRQRQREPQHEAAADVQSTHSEADKRAQLLTLAEQRQHNMRLIDSQARSAGNEW